MGLISYIKKRKRNAVTFILILIPFKTVIHYLFFKPYYGSPTYLEIYKLKYLLPFKEGSVLAWLLSIIILSLIVFAISDKIKAR